MELTRRQQAARAATTELVLLPDETLDQWASDYLPGLDVFYADKQAVDQNLRGSLVFDRQHYIAHPTFQDVRYVNTYLHWNLRREVPWVIVANPEWIGAQPEAARRRLLATQIRLERGLVFPRSHIDEITEALTPYLFDDTFVLTHALWDTFTPEVRRQFMRREQAVWDDLHCHPVPDGVAPHIRDLANRFSEVDGANCLATVAECVTGEAWLGRLWLHEGEFCDRMVREGLAADFGNDEPQPGDVVIFHKREFQHAAYCVAPDRFISKNGQSRFNPIRVVDMAMLRNDWRRSEIMLYRRRDA